MKSPFPALGGVPRTGMVCCGDDVVTAPGMGGTVPSASVFTPWDLCGVRSTLPGPSGARSVSPLRDCCDPAGLTPCGVRMISYSTSGADRDGTYGGDNGSKSRDRLGGVISVPTSRLGLSTTCQSELCPVLPVLSVTTWSFELMGCNPRLGY